jgi:hypothetical protein
MLKSNFSSVFLCIIMLVCVSFVDAQNKQVVLLSGQSNMAGAGNYETLDESIKERIKKVSNRVLVSYSIEKPPVPLSYYDNKPSEKYNFTQRFGPELLIGLTLAEAYPNQEYLLIKESRGGTSLYGAWNPNWSEEKSKEIEKGEDKQEAKLFLKHCNNIKKNLEKLTAEGKSHQIIGMVWMQGENDAASEVSARSYKENLKTLIASYRNEFNLKHMPFIAGQINSSYGDFPEGPDMVRQAFVDVANEDKYVDVIKTSTDTSWSDYPKHEGVHYNTEGQRRLGIAFAEALLKLQN